MILPRRAFLSGSTLCGAAMLASRIVAATPSGERRFAMVELSTSGVTTSVYTLSKEMVADAEGLSGFERLAPIRFGEDSAPIAVPLEAGSGRKAVDPTVDVLVSQIDFLIAKANVMRSDISVLTSSGFEAFAGPLIPMIRARLRERTGMKLDVVTPRDEARLQFDWIVPARQRDKVFQIDIGSGNTKGGYYDRPGHRRHFHDLSTPFGTKTMAAAVKGRWPETGTFDFPARATQFYTETVADTLTSQIKKDPAIQQLPMLYLTGGIIWACAVILHPKAMATHPNWLELAPDDFAEVGKLVEAGTPYGIVPADLSDEQRAWLLKTRATIRNIFNPHQIAAGAALVDGLSRQLVFAERKKLLFPVFARNTWSSQYLIERFAGSNRAQG